MKKLWRSFVANMPDEKEALGMTILVLAAIGGFSLGSWFWNALK